MQQPRYFYDSWHDITSSAGWFVTIMKLALVLLIPIFGAIVVYGYLYTWARERAWGINQPMPRRIFENKDGKLYSRGGLIFIISIIVAAVSSLFLNIDMLASVTRISQMLAYSPQSFSDPNVMFSMLPLYVVPHSGLFGMVVSVILTIVGWIMSMRIAIYDSFNAGFRLDKVWKMLTHNILGILKVWLVSFIATVVVTIIGSIVACLIVIIPLVVFFAMSGATVNAAIAAIFLIIPLVLLAVYVAMVFGMIENALVIRALGYWTETFNVPEWGSYAEPLPFEKDEAAQRL